MQVDSLSLVCSVIQIFWLFESNKLYFYDSARVLQFRLFFNITFGSERKKNCLENSKTGNLLSMKFRPKLKKIRTNFLSFRIMYVLAQCFFCAMIIFFAFTRSSFGLCHEYSSDFGQPMIMKSFLLLKHVLIYVFEPKIKQKKTDAIEVLSNRLNVVNKKCTKDALRNE